MPGLKQAWPNSAACWSPAMPPSGTSRPPSTANASPWRSEEGTTRGSTARGMRNRSSMPSSQSPVRMSSSSVRLALVASVMCWLPPESFQASQLSTVPNASSPCSARRRSVGSLSSSQASLVPEK
jgi:hypothetical protein